MYTQHTDWGYINYCDALQESGANSLIAGITTLLPDKVFPPHIHYGQEQIVYIIEGQGDYIINGEKHHVSKGDIIHMPPDAVHETHNTGGGVIHELFVNSLPRFDLEFTSMDSIASCYGHHMLEAAIQMLKQPLLSLTSVPFMILDEAGAVAFQGGAFNGFCLRNCRPDAAPPACYQALGALPPGEADGQMKQLVCPHGITVYSFPILYNGHELGAVCGGHVRESKTDSHGRDGELYAVTDSNVMGARVFLKRIVKSICSFCSFYSMYQNLQDRDAMIHQAELSRSRLEENLSVTQNVITNLRINHHFLFNTLNAIACMTFDAKRDDLYNAITNLAKMLRYTTRVSGGTVPLREELEYVDTYLRMQRLRYGDSLSAQYDIEEGLDDIPVPFNFLQPIIENAFAHGFTLSASRDKRIGVRICHTDGLVQIEVANNGTPLAAEELERIRKGFRAQSSHGLSLIHGKLAAIYQDRFHMDIFHTADAQVCVQITLPDYSGGAKSAQTRQKEAADGVESDRH